MATLHFEEFSFDATNGELRRNGVRVPLERQPALALERLLRSAGEPVSREDLVAAVWPATTHVKFDDGLNYCVRQIRVALDDDPKSPRFIVTVPRRGYRFIAPIEFLPNHHRPRRRPALIAAMAIVVLLTAFAESQPNNHHVMAIRLAAAIHDLLY